MVEVGSAYSFSSNLTPLLDSTNRKPQPKASLHVVSVATSVSFTIETGYRRRLQLRVVSFLSFATILRSERALRFSLFAALKLCCFT